MAKSKVKARQVTDSDPTPVVFTIANPEVEFDDEVVRLVAELILDNVLARLKREDSLATKQRRKRKEP